MGDVTASCKQAIHGYVLEDVRQRFEEYQQRIGLTSLSALLTLLILREIELKRLPSTASLIAAHGSGPRRPKISAYLGSAHAEAFKVHARRLGRSASDCAGLLVELELKERWLERALKDGEVP